MEEKYLKGNKLIAEFMGWDKTEPINSTLFEQSIKHTQYHRSWDWLMPVVEKIESIESYVMKKETMRNIRLSIPNIDLVYPLVVEFIEWYNENIKK